MKWWVYNPGTSEDPRYAGPDWEEYEVDIEVQGYEIVSIEADTEVQETFARIIIDSDPKLYARIIDAWYSDRIREAEYEKAESIRDNRAYWDQQKADFGVYP